MKQIGASTLNVYNSSIALVTPQRSAIRFGTGFTVADDSVNQQTVVTGTGVTSATLPLAITAGNIAIGAVTNVPGLDLTQTGYVGLSSVEKLPSASLVLVNGVNDNITLPNRTSVDITGPTAGFTITGFIAPASTPDGTVLDLNNLTGFDMTIGHQAGTSTAGNRIIVPGGANKVCPVGSGTTSVARLKYNASQTRWLLVNELDGSVTVTSLTSGGHITASPSTGAVTLGSDANSTATPSTICAYDGSGNCVAQGFLLAGTSGAGVTQGAAAGGNGVPLIIQAQAGPVAGKTGGAAKLLSGTGGTPGTDAAGTVVIGLGQPVANVSTKCSFQTTPGTEIAYVQQVAAGTTTLGSAQSILITSASATAQIQCASGQVIMSGATLAMITGSTCLWQVGGFGTVCTDTFSSTTQTRVWASTCTSLSDTIAQSTTGVGASRTIGAQQGLAGNAGGAININTGAGGTPGTNLGGALNIDVGAMVSNQSAPVNFKTNGTVWATLSVDPSDGTRLASTTQAVTLRASSLIALATGTDLYFEVGSGHYFWYGGATQYRADVIAAATTMTWASVTSVTETMPASAARAIKTGIFQIQDVTSGNAVIEYNQLAAAQRVVSLCRNATVTTTTMPAGSGDLVVNMGNCAVVPTVAPDNTGIEIYTTASQLSTLDTNLCRTNLSYRAQNKVTNFTNVLHGCGQLTYALAATSGAIASIKATDVDAIAKKPVMRIKWTLIGWDVTKGTASFAIDYITTIRSTSGTGWAVIATQAIGTADNDTGNTYSGNVTVSGNDVIFTVTSNSTDSVNWTVFYEARCAAGIA